MKNILIIGFAILLLTGCFGSEPNISKYKGTQMPSFKLLLADSISFLDTKDIPTGKPTVLLYYSPYCPYSRGQMEEIVEEIQSFKDYQLIVFTAFPYSDMKKFYKHYQLSKHPNIIAGIDYMHFFGNYYGISGVPYIAVYGKDKKFRHAFDGKVSTKQILNAIN